MCGYHLETKPIYRFFKLPRIFNGGAEWGILGNSDDISGLLKSVSIIGKLIA